MEHRQDANSNGRPTPTKNKGPGVFKVWLHSIKLTIFILVIAGVGLLVWWHFHPINHDRVESQAVNTKEYQAVFLTNGQVYFGKLNVESSVYMKLTDIYYLQVQQSIQPSTTNPSKTPSGSNVQLVKLGSELHGPEDEMSINRQQVLFWENLKPDSKVAQAINHYQNQ